jgi:starch-binding outer membrane protein, SusD/RagB family
MKKINLYIFLALIATFLSSCDNYLSVEPENGLTLDKYWKTKEQVKASAIACYQSMMTGSGSDYQVVELAFLWGEIRADMLAAGPRVSFSESNVLNGYITEDLSISNWAPIYKTINLCNTLIECAPKVMEKDPTFTQEALDGYLSEALAIRSLMYFYLVRTFGEVPLKLDASITDKVNLSIPKSSSSVILNQIVSDLKHAEEKSVTNYGNNKENKGRITQYAINAMQADVYLWREQYDSCLIACSKVVNSGQYGLMMNYRNLFMTGKTNESIFELVYDEQLLNPLYSMLNTSTGKRFVASQRVIDNIYMLDENNSENYDYRGNWASVRFANMGIWKYIGLTSTAERASEEAYAPWIFYRYADILMMIAEADAQLGNFTESAYIISVLRERGNALAVTAEGADVSSAEGLTDYIMSERAREFAFEGKRWFDLLRSAKRNHYARKDILLNLVLDIAPTDRQATMYNNMQDTLSHYLPIFKDELETDDALIQNTFYKTN